MTSTTTTNSAKSKLKKVPKEHQSRNPSKLLESDSSKMRRKTRRKKKRKKKRRKRRKKTKKTTRKRIKKTTKKRTKKMTRKMTRKKKVMRRKRKRKTTRKRTRKTIRKKTRRKMRRKKEMMKRRKKKVRKRKRRRKIKNQVRPHGKTTMVAKTTSGKLLMVTVLSRLKLSTLKVTMTSCKSSLKEEANLLSNSVISSHLTSNSEMVKDFG